MLVLLLKLLRRNCLAADKGVPTDLFNGPEATAAAAAAAEEEEEKDDVGVETEREDFDLGV